MRHPRVIVVAFLLAILVAGAAHAATFKPTGELEIPADRSCGTPIPSLQMMTSVEKQLELVRGRLQTLAVGGQIKVAFHVIYSGSEGNMPLSQINAQIAELNKAYSGFYGGANTGYTFVLATRRSRATRTTGSA